MAPPGKRGGPPPSARPRPADSAGRRNNRWPHKIRSLFMEHCTLDNLKRTLVDPGRTWIAAILLLAAEVVVNIVVIQKVPYTEIDWKAYMQEVEGFLNGTRDYSQLKGDTGPLVYPAGFVYIFSILYAVTNQGTNIRVAQYIFAVIYLINLALVFRIYHKSRKVPPFVLVFLCCTSYRVHSIYVLRLFNDPVAMLLLYSAVVLFTEDYWTLGSLAFSLAVSVKMNVLLFAPALLLAYVTALGPVGAVKQLTVCAAVQLVLAAPFLAAEPVAYVMGAFDLGRVFQHQWTVNWRFLAEPVFVHRGFHLGLLGLHVLTLAAFAPSWLRCLRAFAKLRPTGVSIVSQLLLLPLFTANLVGVALSRSLHYQFYVWYFHTLPYLLWATPYSNVARLCLLGVVELCWNTYPSTAASSAALHVCHAAVLWGLFRARNPSLRQAKAE